MNRLPIRVRLTLAFAVAIAAVLTGGGYLLYDRLATSLDRTLAQGLATRAADVGALVKQADPGLREAPPAPVADAAGSFAQVLDSRGRIHDQTRGLGSQPLLGGPLLARARRGCRPAGAATELVRVTEGRRMNADHSLILYPGSSVFISGSFPVRCIIGLYGCSRREQNPILHSSPRSVIGARRHG